MKKGKVERTKKPRLRHINCKDADCQICLEDHTYLGKYLDEMTGNDRVDHLGKYHKWLSDRGIPPETEWGWATEEAFNIENIEAYIDWFITDWFGGDEK